MPIHLGKKGEKMSQYNVTSDFQTVPLAMEDLSSLEVDTYNYYIGLLKQ